MNSNQYPEIFSVTSSDCILAIDGSFPDILGTYIIVKWIEIVSAKNIKRYLNEEHITVGEKIVK
jgi:predicted thioesterase